MTNNVGDTELLKNKSREGLMEVKEGNGAVIDYNNANDKQTDANTIGTNVEN